VVCLDAGVGSLDVSVEGPGGSSDTLPTAVNQHYTDSDTWVVQYTPLVAGPHTVNVLYDGQPVTRSPFTTLVRPR